MTQIRLVSTEPTQEPNPVGVAEILDLRIDGLYQTKVPVPDTSEGSDYFVKLKRFKANVAIAMLAPFISDSSRSAIQRLVHGDIEKLARGARK